jgi:hypothetical protein
VRKVKSLGKFVVRSPLLKITVSSSEFVEQQGVVLGQTGRELLFVLYTRVHDSYRA